MYILSKLDVYIHIPNTNESIIKKKLHNKQVTQGYTCISNSFNKIYIYMKLNSNMKIRTKIGNTSQNA